MKRQVLPCEHGLTLRCSFVFYAQPYGANKKETILNRVELKRV